MDSAVKDIVTGIKKCISSAAENAAFEVSNDGPDEGCINCILDTILRMEEGSKRNIWIKWLKSGEMSITCERTGKTYPITGEFFNKYFGYL